MSRWINFKELRAQVSLEDVLFRYYRLDLPRQGSKVIGPCPVHGGSSKRAFHADLDRNVWHCFSKCKCGGNQLDFVAKRDGLSIRDAALRLQDFFLGPGADPPPAPSPTTNQPQAQRKKEPERAEGNPPLAVNLNLAHDHPHLLSDRGLQVDTCEHFDVGYCRRGVMRSCIAFPIHNRDGVLVAYAGRRLKPQDVRQYGKYKLPKGFRKELELYNLHRAAPLAGEHGLILVEGFFSVLKLYEAGYENAVACMGSELSTHQATLIAELASECIVLFDGDEAGWAGADAVRECLSERLTVRVAKLPPGAEPDTLSPRALRWLVNGMQALDLDAVSLWVRPTGE